MSDPEPGSEPRPDTAAAGNALLYVWGSLLCFGLFLVVVPGRVAPGRTWLWVGLVLVVVGAAGLVPTARASARYLRKKGQVPG